MEYELVLTALQYKNQLPLIYDPDALQKLWKKYPGTCIIRCGAIACELLPLAGSLLIDWAVHARIEPEPDARRARVKAYAVKLRDALTRLGPTFIKFGQMLSIRPDLVPPEAIPILQGLCDTVPAFDTQLAIAQIEAELGVAINEVFDGIGPNTLPVAAASLGQVYKARLRRTGATVAVKVQRPDMLRAVSLDLFLMRHYMSAVQFIKGQLTVQKPYDVALFDTFAAASLAELDYR